MEVHMENVKFALEIPTVIRVNGGKYDKEKDCTSIEIESSGLHVVFDLPGKYKSKFAQKRLAEGIRRLDEKGLLHLSHTRLWLILQQLP